MDRKVSEWQVYKYVLFLQIYLKCYFAIIYNFVKLMLANFDERDTVDCFETLKSIPPLDQIQINFARHI